MAIVCGLCKGISYREPQCIMEYIERVWRPSTFDLVGAETVQLRY